MNRRGAAAGQSGLGLRIGAAVVAKLLRLLARTWRIEYRGVNPFSHNESESGERFRLGFLLILLWDGFQAGGRG